MDSGRCSRDPSRTILFRSWAVVLLLTAALLFVPYAFSAEPASSPVKGAPGDGLPGVRIVGLPDWLGHSAARSLSVVWREMSSDGIGDARLEILRVVSERLFPGFLVTVDEEQNLPVASFSPQIVTNWDVECVVPPLSDALRPWFLRDIDGMSATIASLLSGFPVAALSWADAALRDEIRRLLAPVLPGWTITILARITTPLPEKETGERNERCLLQVAFSPEQPLVLAVVPRVYSSSLPVVLRSDLNEALLKGMSPVIGIPVLWAKKHASDIERIAEFRLSDRNTVVNSMAKVHADFVPEQISRIDADVESRRYILRAWAATYLGTDDRYPEFGLHVGRKALPWSGWDVELYAEWIVRANDLHLESRYGAEWSLFPAFSIGGEVSYPGGVFWWKARTRQDIGHPYLWWRMNTDNEHNIGLGVRINEHISIELHYDERDADSMSLRLIGNL